MKPRFILYILNMLVLSSFIHAQEPVKTAQTSLSVQENQQTLVINEALIAEEHALIDEVFLEIVEHSTKASYYHDKFNGKFTANGEIFDNQGYTAAHRSLPFGTKVKVTNLHNDQWVVVRVNDRGPFTKGRGLDISKKAFLDLTDSTKKGVLEVKIEKWTQDEG